MLVCQDCKAGENDEEARFERREYVRQDSLVDRNDESAGDEEIVYESLAKRRLYRCVSCGGYEVSYRH